MRSNKSDAIYSKRSARVACTLLLLLPLVCAGCVGPRVIVRDEGVHSRVLRTGVTNAVYVPVEHGSHVYVFTEQGLIDLVEQITAP